MDKIHNAPLNPQDGKYDNKLFIQDENNLNKVITNFIQNQNSFISTDMREHTDIREHEIKVLKIGEFNVKEMDEQTLIEEMDEETLKTMLGLLEEEDIDDAREYAGLEKSVESSNALNESVENESFSLENEISSIDEDVVSLEKEMGNRKEQLEQLKDLYILGDNEILKFITFALERTFTQEEISNKLMKITIKDGKSNIKTARDLSKEEKEQLEQIIRKMKDEDGNPIAEVTFSIMTNEEIEKLKYVISIYIKLTSEQKLQSEEKKQIGKESEKKLEMDPQNTNIKKGDTRRRKDILQNAELVAMIKKRMTSEQRAVLLRKVQEHYIYFDRQREKRRKQALENTQEIKKRHEKEDKEWWLEKQEIRKQDSNK